MHRKQKLIVVTTALLLLSSLLACQPTPDSEIVVNKGDRVLEEKISAAASAQSPTGAEGENAAPVYQYTFPDRWDEVYDAGNGLTLTFTAEITQKTDGIYPVYRTRKRPMDAETMGEMLGILLPSPVSMKDRGMTKEDWKEEMEQYVKEMEEHQARLLLPPEERGDGDDTPITQEEIDERLKWYAEQMAEAPDALEEVAVTDFSGVRNRTGQTYRLSDGDSVYIYFSEDAWWIERSVSEFGYVVPDYSREMYGYDGLVWKNVTIEQETALALGQETLDKLGLGGFALESMHEANYIGEAGLKHPLSAGYTMRFMRDYGGYPMVSDVDPDENLVYGDDNVYAVNEPLDGERVDVYVDETGVRYMYCYGLKEVIREENPAVELLDFETIQERVRKALTYGLAGDKVGEVYKIVLSTNTQRVADSDEFYEVPCWILYLDTKEYGWCKTEEEKQADKARDRNDPNCIKSALYINAIDGSVFHVNYGW